MNTTPLQKRARVLTAAAGLAFGFFLPAASAQQQAPNPHAGHKPEAGRKTAPAAVRALPPLPDNLPGWMRNKQANHIFYKRGPYNHDIYNIRPLAYDLNAVAVGHSMAYEDLVTGKADRLETATYTRINQVLKNPPKLMPDERMISPTFARRYGVLEQVFDWTHILHAQTVDVLASTKLTQKEKDAEIERLWAFYFESVPYAITPLPMNMAYLDSQPYSGAFRKKYPKVNGLFWGYHWLQGAMYDMLYNKTLAQQRAAYAVVGEQYRKTELYKTTRPFMPMFAEVSPTFSAKFPHIANAFDNLHMLHDMVNDILASDWMTERQKDEQIQRALYLVSAHAHPDEKPGQGKAASGLHDHRHLSGMPGMGMMKGATTEVMYMPEMGWMRMDDCHHCSMPLVGSKPGFRPAQVSADGWTMRVRCALCARDMSAETKGQAILDLPTEDPARSVVLISDDQGNLTLAGEPMPGLVFLEDEGSHAHCDAWSQAFTSRAAFDAYVKANPKYADTKPLTLAEWSERAGKKPDTYVKPQGPVENPYADKTAKKGAVKR